MQKRSLESFKDAEGFFEFNSYCPFCHGESADSDEIICAHCDGDDPDCETCKGEGVLAECPVCSGDPFEIYWNWVFALDYPLSMDFDEAYALAWENGWLLIEYDNDYWLAAGSCGYDFSWERALVVLKICGELPIEYAESMGNGGYVFVSDEERDTLIQAAIAAYQKKAKRIGFEIEYLQKLAAAFADELVDDSDIELAPPISTGTITVHLTPKDETDANA